MKRLLSILLFFIFSISAFSQYYIKGEVKDQKGSSLQNVKIIVHSTNLLYRTGVYGALELLLQGLLTL